MTTFVGIDPAPSKAAAIWTEGGLRRVPALKLPETVRSLVELHDRIVLAWDAPLQFDASVSMSDRPIDKAARAWSKRLENEGAIESKAISVLTFSSCSHWAITCATLGFPFGTPPGGLCLASRPDDDALDAYTGYWLAEAFVHGDAALLGDLVTGGYVVPLGPSFDDLSEVFRLSRYR